MGLRGFPEKSVGITTTLCIINERCAFISYFAVEVPKSR
jgi:hypothetical protein